MITGDILKKVMPSLSEAKCTIYLPFLQSAMDEFDINTPLRMAAFLAQIAYESGELRFMEELWGPTPIQRRYEPPSSIATRLGNIHPGDGKRFRGRGAFQIKGRTLYEKYGRILGVDLVNNPDLAAAPQLAFRIAGVFWRFNGQNELADLDHRNFIALTRRINSGLAGLEIRMQTYNRVKQILLGVEVQDGEKAPPSKVESDEIEKKVSRRKVSRNALRSVKKTKKK